ncbi:DUF4381 domain-containing protein [Methylomonas paludis]|uniref:DUF4381 domain-containing protein n=2 Tax=Methylomonas paludis TaxID=1173101 RepID=A0A975MR53_9GAMM|nr:DUF4381 domain-containing protein [Methylomonas paludis]
MEPLPLRDIHLPEPISWWPPAPGWWLVAILVLILITLAGYLYRRAQQRIALQTAAKLLLAIRNNPDRDNLETLIALSAWLRRVAISTTPRSDVASLSGQDWLAFLDKSFTDAPFSQGVGQCLANAQYRQSPPDTVEFAELFSLCERWLKRQKPAGNSTGLLSGVIFRNKP